jgi:hypothetical protein
MDWWTTVKRILVLATVGVIAVSVVVASAATFGGLTTRLAGGASASVSRCDTNGFAVSYGVSSASITSVTVADIADPDCEGAEVRVTLTSATGASLRTGGPVTVTADAGTTPNSVVIPVTATTETSVVGIQISVTGP